MEILGQLHVLHYLIEGIRTHRLSPSLLFTGQHGIGKRSCAIELAKCFCCQQPPTTAASTLPRCNQCRPCAQVAQNNHADVLVIDRPFQATLLKEKPESQTAIKIETVRFADKFVNYKPLEGKRRVVIIDEAHRMNNESANALLKLLEEPPHNAQLVLIATSEHTLPSTILSRCAVLRFRPVPVKTLANWLEKEYAVAESNALEFAERAGGSFEKALQLKEENHPTTDLSDYTLDEFFTLLSETNWRKEGKKNAETAILSLTESAQRRLHDGDISQVDRLRALFQARQQIDRHVPPKLVLQNLFLKIEGIK